MKQLIIGKKAILDAIKNKTLISATISNKDKIFFNKVKNFLSNVEINNDKFFYDNITNNFSHHQFAIGYVTTNARQNNLDEIIQKIKKNGEGIILILDEINDPQNFGSIIRSAECFKIDAIIYKKNNQCQITSSVIKTSTGAIANINLINVSNLINVINKLKANGFWIYCSCLDKNSQNCNNITFDKKTVIIVGNEKKGVSPILLKNSDFKIQIKTFGITQSLNVASATAILLYAIKNNNK